MTKWTLEARERRSRQYSGSGNNRFGTKHSEKTKQKMSSTWLKRRENIDFSKITNYRVIHVWLHKLYGKPRLCENKNCPKTSHWFEYALKKGRLHSVLRDNYLELCRYCHRIYDDQGRKGWETRRLKLII